MKRCLCFAVMAVSLFLVSATGCSDDSITAPDPEFIGNPPPAGAIQGMGEGPSTSLGAPDTPEPPG
ncbi:MAG: hypothetical protein ACI87E_001516 [Mariniblastus sp.]|jgi:hypothetical protein